MGAGGAGKVRKQAAGPGAGKAARWGLGFPELPTLCQACLGWVALAGRCLGGTPGATRLGRVPAVSMMTPAVPEQGQTSGWGPGGTLGTRSVNATTWNDLREHVAERFLRRTWARRGDLPHALLEANRGPGFTEALTLRPPPDTRTHASRAQWLREQEFRLRISTEMVLVRRESGDLRCCKCSPETMLPSLPTHQEPPQPRPLI